MFIYLYFSGTGGRLATAQDPGKGRPEGQKPEEIQGEGRDTCVLLLQLKEASAEWEIIMIASQHLSITSGIITL